MIVWGVNALNHGSSLAVFDNNKLISNTVCSTDELSAEVFYQALSYGKPEKIYWYERPWVKKSRQLYAGQFGRAFDLSVLPSAYLKRCQLGNIPVTYTPHHASHAAAGYYTSPFNETAIIVLDAIGEWECASIWQGKDGKMQRLWSKNYPNSLGLYFSAFTDLLGLEPVRDEYKLQNLAKTGNPGYYYKDVKKYVWGIMNMKYNLHKGVENWPYGVTYYNRADLAAAVQKVFEEQVCGVVSLAKKLTESKNLVYMGGCAMNDSANALFQDKWEGIWSLPQPGDPSSSIGAVLYHTREKIDNFLNSTVKHIEIKV